MNINFPLILVVAVLISGLVYVVDWAILAKRRGEAPAPVWIEYPRSFFPILLTVLLIRSFLVEPFRIPTGSLEPTLLVGDFIAVNKYDYGLRLPVLDSKILPISEPKRGDIIVFHWPPNPSIDYIKRVVGVPGDKISYINKVLYINGQPMTQQAEGVSLQQDEYGNTWKVLKMQEDLAGVKHNIYLREDVQPQDFSDVVVPKGQYFAMGDNRDDSQDSRYWGFVPEGNLVGKAVAVWFSWNGITDSVRWHRIGRLVH